MSSGEATSQVSAHYFNNTVRFKILMVVTIKIAVFWGIMSCCLVEVCSYLRDAYCYTMRIHLHHTTRRHMPDLSSSTVVEVNNIQNTFRPKGTTI